MGCFCFWVFLFLFFIYCLPMVTSYLGPSPPVRVLTVFGLFSISSCFNFGLFSILEDSIYGCFQAGSFSNLPYDCLWDLSSGFWCVSLFLIEIEN